MCELACVTCDTQSSLYGWQAYHPIKLSILLSFLTDGGRNRIRTYDPLIKSQLLYQLSYAPIRSRTNWRFANVRQVPSAGRSRAVAVV